MMTTSSYPMTNIVAPCEHDALSGRGGHTIHWSGNIKFRALVEQHRARYHAASRVGKGKVVAEVVQLWRKMTPPGRFLALSDPKAGDASPWHDIGDKAAQKKTAKRLREGLATNITMSTTASTVSSDEFSSDSSISSNHSAPVRSEGNFKRALRRVSNDGMEKSAKRARMEMAVTESMGLLPMMDLPLEEDLSQVTWDDDYEPAPAWTPTEDNEEDDLLGLSAEDFNLDTFFEEKQESTLVNKASSMDNFHEWLISLPFPCVSAKAFTELNAGCFGSPLLQDIAGAIPSAAALTESKLFD